MCLETISFVLEVNIQSFNGESYDGCISRGSLKLKSLGRAHAPLHMLLWQAREAQSTLLAAAAAQKTLFTDIAAWASSENRALSDVCSCASELSTLYSGALTQLALAFKSFRKEMSLVLEGEKRCDATQKRLQDAESKRIKLRRQVCIFDIIVIFTITFIIESFLYLK